MNHFWSTVTNILKVGAPVVAEAIGTTGGSIGAALVMAILSKVDQVNGKLPGTTTPCALDSNPEFHSKLVQAEQLINDLYVMAQQVLNKQVSN